MVELPYTRGARPDLFGPEGTPSITGLPTVDDAGAPLPLARIRDTELAERTRSYDAGCKLRSGEACYRLGAALVAVDDARALGAFEVECAVDGATRSPLGLKGECMDVRREVVRRAAAHRAVCTKRDPAGCDRLARLLYHVDVVRAPAALAEEVALRGVEIHPAGAAGFVIDGIRRFQGASPERSNGSPAKTPADVLREAGDFGMVESARVPSVDELTAIPEESPPAPPTANQPEVWVHVLTPTVRGPIDAAQIKSAIEARLDRIRNCYRVGLARNPGLTGRVGVRFVVDRSGHAWSLRDGGSDMPDGRVIACVAHTFDSLELSPPAGLVEVDAFLLMAPPEPRAARRK